MKPGIKTSSLSNQDLSALEQQILAERSQQVTACPTMIVTEPNASEESHQEVIKTLLERKFQSS